MGDGAALAARDTVLIWTFSSLPGLCARSTQSANPLRPRAAPDGWATGPARQPPVPGWHHRVLPGSMIRVGQ